MADGQNFLGLNTTAKDLIGAINEIAARPSGSGSNAFILKGTTTPISSQGNDGQIYLKYDPNSSNEITNTYLKVNGTWQDLIGADIADVDSKYFPKIYGFSISGSTVTYLEDEVGLTPAHMDFSNDVFDYGSWENAFFMPKPCMLKNDGTVDYYLNPDDYSKKADGTPSDISDDNYTGNAMMEFPQIWVKVVPNGNDVSVYISNKKVDNSYVCWWNYDENDLLKEHFYTPIYNGSIVNDGSNDVIRSLSGKTYSQLCQSKTATVERTMARRNGTGWDTEVYSDYLITIYLLILMGQSLNMQSVFGKGRCGKSQGASNMLGTGTMNTKGLFWGSNTTDYGVKVFGMENFWGNQYRRKAGLVNVNRTWKYKLTRGTADGSFASDYNDDGTDYLTQSQTSPFVQPPLIWSVSPCSLKHIPTI